MKKMKWAICGCCEGNGRVENPAFERGFTSSEWRDMAEEEQQAYMQGDYDVPCKACDGTGKVRVPNVAAMTFAEKRELVIERCEARANARADAAIAAEWAAERTFG